MVERAVSEGATIVSGVYIPQQAGFYYPPTLLINCTQDMEIIQEELLDQYYLLLSISQLTKH